MKISTQTLMLLGNPQHPDYGTYAKFITGMGKEVDVGDRMKLCEKCYRPRIDTEAIPVCLYCRGYADAQDKKEEPKPEKLSLKDRINNHNHKFTNRINKPCIICGIYKVSWEIIND
jgi:hypothetical protein